MGRRGGLKWKQISAVLRCPFCRRYLVSEYAGEYKLRGPSEMELLRAGIEKQPCAEAQTVLSRARVREDEDEGAERGDGA